MTALLIGGALALGLVAVGLGGASGMACERGDMGQARFTAAVAALVVILALLMAWGAP